MENIHNFRQLGAEVFPGIPVGQKKGQDSGGSNGPDYEECRVISLKNLEADTSEIRLYEDDKRLVLAPKRFQGRLRLRQGDILLTARGSVLKAAMVRDEPEFKKERILPSNNLLVIRLGSAIRPEIVFAYLSSGPVRTKLSDHARSSSGVLSISARIVEELEIDVPTEAHQEQLARLIALGDQQYRLGVAVATLRRDLARQLVLGELDAAGAERGSHAAS